ncbi:TonB-dependent receptor [Solimicrobium silvestre]|uniref:TonB-Xanth-Caul: TonB-dependent receptor n=1 Tax=Solimicrobium silvestre TaxID=2099400 RepID=A0A2S9H5C2_9BURK|nr:TonB-dependent receptor [Solimicrobium silvestre]PRC95190.1 TonB-Xanth-Caul: TonB-dependent receptor [Solimicrobium silvestre]
MKIFTTKRSQVSGLNSVIFKISPIAAGCAILLSTAGSVYAQQADKDQQADASANTVVVTGIRSGIENAISVKRDSTSIVEAISAEDIGQLPDQSIAESIARLPGVAAQRVAGRAQTISIRGLSPDFASTTLNGREQATTGDNRAAEFDQYPAELFGGVVIYKTPDAALIDQGLSGTIDMQTFDPLAFPGRTVSMNVRGEKNSLGPIANSSDKGNRFSINYIDQFADRTIGIQIGVAHLQSPRNDHETGLYEPWSVNQLPGTPANTSEMNGIKSLATSGTTKRDGLVSTLEWKPNKDFTSKVDLFYSKFSEITTANQWEENLSWGGGNNPSPVFTSANASNGVLNGGTLSGVYPLVRGEYNDREDNIKSLGWGNTMKFDGWKLLADLNYSKAVRNENYHEMNTQLITATGGPVLDTSNVNWATGGFPTMNGGLNYSNPNTLYLNNTIYGEGSGHAPHTDDTVKGFKLVATINAPKSIGDWVSDFNVGADYTDHIKNHSNLQGNQNLIAPNGVVISPGLLYSPVNLGFSGTGTIPSFNVPGIMAQYFQPFNPDPNAPQNVAAEWSVTEKIATTFVKANLDHQLSSSINLRGNIGLQVQGTKQSSTGEVGFNNEVTPTTVGKSYTDVLPQMNLVFELPDNEVIRFAAGKQVMRPRLDDLNSGFNFSVATSTQIPSGNGGNPQLNPWRANSVDLAFEKYFGKKAYVSAAMYYKKLTSYIYDESNLYNFSQWTPGTIAITNTGFYSSQYNGQGGSIEGLELTSSLPLDMLTPSLKGFGLQASTGLNNSAITVKSSTFDVGSAIPLPGMSKHVASLTAYYEMSGFSARIGARYRSEFVGDIENFSGNRNLRFIAPETIVDAQIEYTFQEGTYKDLGLFLQLGNLTNAAYKTYQGTPNQPLEYEKYGSTLLAGLNYKF